MEIKNYDNFYLLGKSICIKKNVIISLKYVIIWLTRINDKIRYEAFYYKG